MNDYGCKTIKGSGLINIEILILLVIDLFLIFNLDGGVINTTIIVLVISVFDLCLIYNRFHYFSYDNNELVVMHLWVSRKRVFQLKNLAAIKLVKAPYNGKSILVTEKSGIKSSFGANTISKKKLDEMLDFLEKKISEFD